MDLLWRLVASVSSALPCFFMGARLARVWKDPQSVEEGRWISIGVGIMVLEFVLAHSGVAFAAMTASEEGRVPKLLGLAGLGLFYFLFAGAIALAFRSRMLLQSFLALIGGRAVAVLLGIGKDQTVLLTMQSIVSIALYFVCTLASVLVPLPRLGLTEDVVKGKVPGSGLWVEQPHRAIGAATIYFFLLGTAELLVLPWIDPKVVR